MSDLMPVCHSKAMKQCVGNPEFWTAAPQLRGEDARRVSSEVDQAAERVGCCSMLWFSRAHFGLRPYLLMTCCGNRQHEFSTELTIIVCSLSFACLLFVVVGIGLGCRSNNRSGKSGGGVISVGVIGVYWVLFIIGNSLLKSPSLPIWFAAWLPAFVLLPLGLVLVRKNWN